MQQKLLYKQIWLLVLAALLLMMLPISTKRSLKGDILPAKYSKINLQNWFDGSWQAGVDSFLNQRFAYRATFVRMYNQIAYSFFNKANANGVIIGKQNYLYEEIYIDAYYGTDFVGRDSIDQKLAKLRAVQDTLGKLNTEVVVIFTATKGSYYPEYFPDHLKREKSLSNLEYYLEQVQELGITHIDFDSWFIDQKQTSAYNLYPKTGTHWSSYAQILVADSLLNFMEELKAVNVPDIGWTDILVTTTPRHEDQDIEDGMNILFDIPDEPLAYPAFYVEQQGRTKLQVLTIADSFWWGIYNLGIPRMAFADGSSFWFYGHEKHPGAVRVRKLDFRSEIEKVDVVLLVVSAPSLRVFAYGWVEKAYALYFGETK